MDLFPRSDPKPDDYVEGEYETIIKKIAKTEFITNCIKRYLKEPHFMPAALNHAKVTDIVLRRITKTMEILVAFSSRVLYKSSKIDDPIMLTLCLPERSPLEICQFRIGDAAHAMGMLDELLATVHNPFPHNKIHSALHLLKNKIERFLRATIWENSECKKIEYPWCMQNTCTSRKIPKYR